MTNDPTCESCRRQRRCEAVDVDGVTFNICDECRVSEKQPEKIPSQEQQR